MKALAPVLTACIGAAAIVIVLAIAVLPADADPVETTPAPTEIVLVASDITTPQPTVTPTPSPRSGRTLAREVVPSPTARVIQRPALTPTPEPTSTPRPTVLAETELIDNGDFEAFDSWYVEQGASVVAGAARDGTGLLRIDPGGGYADQRFTIEPGITYQLSVWVALRPDGGSAQIGVSYEDNGYRVVHGEDPLEIGDRGSEWSQVVITFTPPAGAHRALISFWKPSGDATLLVDDVSVRPFVASD